MTLRNNGITASTAPIPSSTGSGTCSTASSSSSTQSISHQQQHSQQAVASQASHSHSTASSTSILLSSTTAATTNPGQISISSSQPPMNMQLIGNTVGNINTLPNDPNCLSSTASGLSVGQAGVIGVGGSFHFMGNNFSNENYSEAIQQQHHRQQLQQQQQKQQQQTVTPTTVSSRLQTLSATTIIHHPHYQNHNPKQFASGGGSVTMHNRSSSTATTQSPAAAAILSSNSSNNSSSTLDQMAIYEEIPDSDHKSLQSHCPLGDLTNLTDEERHKLEEIRIKRDTLKAEIQKLREEIFNVKKELSRIDSVSTGDLSSLGGGNSSSNLKSDNETNKLRKLQIGKKKFNMDPKKGIEFLFENDILEKTPQDVAAFLYKGEGLTKMSIGTYLGENIPFNLAVLDAFIELHDFRNLLLVKALRQFLYSFRLPGEAQKIDRIMEKFAGHYCKHNEGVFNSADTCYVLCFAVIMLNTTLHNPNVKTKMNAEQFVNMNRGINNGDDLPQSYLHDLYESIRTEPFKMPEDDGFTFFNPDREGWLWKQGGRYKNWKRRWFLLSDKCLYYFENTNDKEPRGIIPLENIGVRDISERTSRPHCIELHSTSQATNVIKACKTDTEGRVIEGRHTVYRLAAGTAQEKDAWLQSLKASVSKSPFHDMLEARKRKAQHN